MKTYTGQFLGGPDDGNFITSDRLSVPVTSTIEMQVDNDDIFVVVIKGEYIWQPKGQYFLWNFHSNAHFMKK